MSFLQVISWEVLTSKRVGRTGHCVSRPDVSRRLYLGQVVLARKGPGRLGINVVLKREANFCPDAQTAYGDIVCLRWPLGVCCQ